MYIIVIYLKIDIDIIQERSYKVNTSLFHWKFWKNGQQASCGRQREPS